MVDVIVIAALVVVVALIVRGMLSGRIRTCDAASCSGSCAGCSASCGRRDGRSGGTGGPSLRLTNEQREALRAIDAAAQKTGGAR